ncbi:hypothetical protein HAX54_031793 [Datura stramonium]|uniref:Uncharacterized protein n=1 Tax=Datura stramonium TaxID=4076 RepID=A0ABS8VAZ7_DATST|nr:hypothetical protein [Datura stramonium]
MVTLLSAASVVYFGMAFCFVWDRFLGTCVSSQLCLSCICLTVYSFLLIACLSYLHFAAKGGSDHTFLGSVRFAPVELLGYC